MEEGPRRARGPPRPESSTSSNTRMTPSSSNSSAVNVPNRNIQSQNSRPSSGASLLQERLRERKVESARQRRRSVDMSGDERGVHSSPVKSPGGREDKRPSSGGIATGKGMGVKQIEEQVSTLHKQNFDLKLELYHRRQRQEALEGRLDGAEKQIAELQEVNEQVVAELERRDQALEEAMDLICQLEDKVENLERDRGYVKSYEAHLESGYFHPSHDDGPPSSPPEFEKQRLAPPKNGVPRMPSFLSEKSQGTEALRSLYLPYYSDPSLPKLQEDGMPDGMNTPRLSARLSVLSESSFLSIYGEKLATSDVPDAPEEEPPSLRRHRATSSVEKWIEARPPPAVSTSIRNAPTLRKSQFLSINQIAHSPLQRLEKLQHTLEKGAPNSTRPRPERATSVQDKQRSKEFVSHVSNDKIKNTINHHQGLPPTPDTISTGTLRHYQNSNDTMAEDRKKDGTFLNSTSTIPTPVTAFHTSTPFVRPHSASETITSRRDGHGWDTDTQTNVTDTASVCSTTSTYSGHHNSRGYRTIAPDLFNFSAGDSWVLGRDKMLNDDISYQLPSQPRTGYEKPRPSSMAEHPRSDGTIVPDRTAISQYIDAPQYGGVPIDTSPRPNLPDRRSSLLATAKLRKTNPVSPTVSNQAATDTSSPFSKESRRPRLPNLRIFGRSDTAPITSNSFQQPALQGLRQNNNLGPKGTSHFEGDLKNEGFEDEDLARATPPPIKRSRAPTVGDVASTYRPTSAGAGPGRRESAFSAFDGQTKGVNQSSHGRSGSVSATGDEEAGGKSTGTGRRWFGLGRAGSLKKN